MKKVSNPRPIKKKRPPPPPPPLPRLHPKPAICRWFGHAAPNLYGQCSRCGDGGLPRPVTEIPLPPVKRPKQDEHIARLESLANHLAAIRDALDQQAAAVRGVADTCERLLDSPELQFVRAMARRDGDDAP